jgi:DNA-binding Lrp family transcriptional regulator
MTDCKKGVIPGRAQRGEGDPGIDTVRVSNTWVPFLATRSAWLAGDDSCFVARESDSKLLALLRANAREPTASLARKLGLARSTVQERIARLEREGTIKGYTIRLSEDGEASRLRAVVMISTDPKRADRVALELRKMPEVRSLSAGAGSFDLIATVETETPARIDALLDRIGRASGVARTVSSIILSEKFSR